MYTNHIHTILVLWYLISALMLGMHQAIRCLLPRMEKVTPAPAAPMVGLDYRMFPALVDFMETFTSPWDLEDSFPMGGADMDDHFVLDLHWKEIPCVWSSSSEKYDAWNAEYDRIYAQQLNDSINTYEAEMDMEWEDEIMGYTLSDIVEFMVLDSEDDPYEDLPFTASMRRSAKVGKSGINYVLNCGAERSIHNAGDKVRK